MRTFASISKKKLPARSTHTLQPPVYGLDRTRQAGTIRHILGTSRIQPKLIVGAPNDVHEKEADRVADAVMRMPDEALVRQPLEEAALTQATPVGYDANGPDLQRQAEDEEEEELLQPKSEGSDRLPVTPGAERAIAGRRGTGQPLPAESRAFFEPRLGRDLSRVRVHTGAQAARLARQIGARAFTLGSDIYFGTGRFSPQTAAGKHLLAHELTHTIQQRGETAGWGAVVRRIPGDETDAGEAEVPTPVLSNPRFTGNRALERILDGRTPRLSSDHDGRRGAVSKVQQALVDLGFELPMYRVDGQYGDETVEAIRQFRDRYGPSPGDELDGATLAVLDRVAPAPGERHEHTVDYDRLLADGRLDITVAIGATDETVLRETQPDEYEETDQPVEALMAERFRTWMEGQGFSLELLGLSGNEYWTATRTITWTDASGVEQSREVTIWINLVVPAAGAAREFGRGLSEDEITIYNGHARYGSGPDFDAKASPLENFRIGIDSALEAAGRRTRVEEARRHGVAIDEEHDLLDMVSSGSFDPNRYRVLFFEACTSLAYLDEIREHVGNPEDADVIATRRPSRFTTVESDVGMRETQRFLEGIFAAESVESMISALNDIQRELHGTSARFPRGGVFTSSGMGDNPQKN
ncbi:hypothetical protein DSCO28_28060 [Desulfosarcina ovata subsp. sediminis]|uniref:Peptidoglycan binding-like domain-containing protein n=1 Tax=Desulfosarcina ovata subsp. sediminis TaxID=885957 RepID=A0A5K7ZQT1_9BACT|nr:DUF4157 domain-containing protein [Desulfosarcina ovata]BBO82240.1 hypothetical protein DSCO28_28060 [Desulfosarcina ovata subsp. sediminis]